MCVCSLISTKMCRICPDYEEDDPYNHTQEPGYGILKCIVCGQEWNYFTTHYTVDDDTFHPEICPKCMRAAKVTSGRIP